MINIPFNKTFSCEYGSIEQLSPLIRRIVARNPGPFTFHGTGTYIVGRGDVAVIDPGPDLPEHVDAILQALDRSGERISHIVVTHTHRDHSPATARLVAAVGNVPTYGYGPHGSGKRDYGNNGAQESRSAPVADRRNNVEEGADYSFTPANTVCSGDIIEGKGWSLACVHTPGHTSNHVCYQLCEEQTLFTGDHVMGWSTSVIAPPDGNMGDYVRSLALLLTRDDRRYWPTHGPCIDNPKAFVQAFIEHRRQREQQIIACLAQAQTQVLDIDTMLPMVYRELPPKLVPAAARSLFATILYLIEQDLVTTVEDTVPPSLTAGYRLTTAGQQAMLRHFVTKNSQS